MKRSKLEEYRRKRDFKKTREPIGNAAATPAQERLFVIQKHAARRLHYDLRLELDGVLKSWAVPKGPSLDPKEKRLAVAVEDHPLDYAEFEGTIPKGQYGGGSVILWDKGVWAPLGDAKKSLEKGELKFCLFGQKLRGAFMLVRLKDGKNWLLFKERDADARTDGDILEEMPLSVKSQRSIDDLGGASISAARAAIEKLSGVKKAPIRAVSPQLATVAPGAPPDDDKWLHEIKFDGYRLIAIVRDGKAQLLTRNGIDWTKRFPETVRALAALPVKTALLDGELVFLEPNGVSNFQMLQNAMSENRTRELHYFVFDILHLNGYDLMEVSLDRRKEVLQGLLGKGVSVHFCEHMIGNGAEMLRQASRLGLEGIISKRRDRPYRPGRGPDWLKSKCVENEDFVIAGFTLSTTSRKRLGALVVATRDSRGRLHYAGRVGTGFTGRSLADLWERLNAIRQSTPSVEVPPSAQSENRNAIWVRPLYVANVQFANRTAEGVLRQPSFLGLRDDVEVNDVQEPAARKPAKSRKHAIGTPIRMTHPDRLLYPDQGLTKAGLAAYYADVAEWMLPHVAGRPLSLVRCPAGLGGQQFFQKHASPGMSPTIRRHEATEDCKQVEYLSIDDLAGLLELVQMNTLELHVWGSRFPKIEQPDQLVFDLDPGEVVPWKWVAAAAIEVRSRLADLKLTSFLKTTGGKGLHVVVPLRRCASWTLAKGFSKAIADAMAHDAPDRYTVSIAKAARKGRVFIDYMRNGRGSTAVAAYSTRALPGATVSVPIEWDEVQTVRSNYFTVKSVPARLRTLRLDPWEELKSVRQDIGVRVQRKLGI